MLEKEQAALISSLSLVGAHVPCPCMVKNVLIEHEAKGHLGLAIGVIGTCYKSEAE